MSLNESKALSNVYGKIQAILMVSPVNFEADDKIIHQRFQGIASQLKDRVSYVVVGQYGEGASLVPELKEDANFLSLQEIVKAENTDSPLEYIRLDYEPQPASQAEDNPSPWVQDPFVVLETPQGDRIFLEPMDHLRKGNEYLAEKIASCTDSYLKPTELMIEGGNILVGDDYALIGRNLLHRNMKKIPRFQTMNEEEAKKEITQRFKHLLGVQYVIWIGRDEALLEAARLGQQHEGFQPFFHLDFFVTLGGIEKEQGHELVFVAKIDENFIAGEKEKFRKEWTQLQGFLDEVEAFLVKDRRGPKFKVRRIKVGLKISPEGKAVVYTYNNALVEWFYGVRRAYLPIYHEVKKLDWDLAESCKKSFESEGFSVYPIEACLDYRLRENGSLNCMVKVLSRSKY